MSKNGQEEKQITQTEERLRDTKWAKRNKISTNGKKATKIHKTTTYIGFYLTLKSKSGIFCVKMAISISDRKLTFVSHMSISILFSFVLLLHYTSEGTSLHFPPLHFWWWWWLKEKMFLNCKKELEVALEEWRLLKFLLNRIKLTRKP